MPNKIGRFDILGEIARSAAACVHKALDPESGQTVALKAVDIKILGENSAEIVRQALQEADNTKILNSHNLVLLYGAGELDGQFCSTMEYVQGNSIANMLTRGDEFSIWDLQDIVRQACQGFDHAHSHQIVHYSLEPAKLMVGWDGTVKILGFGISSLSVHTAHLVAPCETMLPYMSPEQVRGEPLDARSNLFSLGAILYEMVTGQKPFAGSDLEQIKRQILEGELAPPNQINPKIHALISEVILKALEKNPDERFQTGQELVNALERRKDEAKPSLSVKAPVASAQAPPMQKKAVSQQASQNEDSAAPELISALDSSAQASPAKAHQKAAAAAAGANGAAPFATGAQQAANPVPRSQAASAAKMSAAPAPAPAVDPLMAEPVKGKPVKSFSEMDELPPLKEVLATAPPMPAVDPIQELRETQFPAHSRTDKPKPQPAEIAKKAVAEIRKTPPKLFLYAIGAAVAIIVLVIAVIASRIHRENADVDGGATTTSSGQTLPQGQNDPQATAGNQSTPAQSQQPTAGKPATLITIRSKPVAKKAGKAAPPVSVQVPGQLTVNSVPAGAQIVVDGHGEPAWLTPYDVTGLAPGHHTISLSKPGFGPETRNVDVASHSKFSLFVQLSQLPATVLVTAEPAGAQILLDGKDTGRVTPSQISVEKSGNHTVLIKKQGYLEESTTVNLQPGQSFRYSPSLRQLGSTDEIKTAGKLKKIFGGAPDGMGSVTVKTQPKGAQIAVNRRLLDKGSPAEFYLNPGTYVIDITLTGFKSIHRVVNMEKSGKLAIDENLDRE